jgi:hypothetical protein
MSFLLSPMFSLQPNQRTRGQNRFFLEVGVGGTKYTHVCKCKNDKIKIIPLLGIYLKECKSGYNKGTCTPMFITALFTKAKLSKEPRCLTTDELIRKCDIYLNGILFNHK